MQWSAAPRAVAARENVCVSEREDVQAREDVCALLACLFACLLVGATLLHGRRPVVSQLLLRQERHHALTHSERPHTAVRDSAVCKRHC